MNREEHLKWAKERALEYLNRGDLINAYASMGSDLSKHDELKGIGEKMSQIGLLYLMSRDTSKLRHWIEGFR